LKYSKDMTQKEIADSLGLSTTAVNRWFSGRMMPTLAAGYRLCKILNITIDQLMEGVIEE